MNDDQITRAFAELREAAERVELPAAPSGRTPATGPRRRLAIPLAAAALAVVLLGSALVTGLVRGSEPGPALPAGPAGPSAPGSTAPPSPDTTPSPSPSATPTPPATPTRVRHLEARHLPAADPFRWVATYDGPGWGPLGEPVLCAPRAVPVPDGEEMSTRVFEQYENDTVEAVETPVVRDVAVRYSTAGGAGAAYQELRLHLADCPPSEDVPGMTSRVVPVAETGQGAIFEGQSVMDGTIVRPTRQIVISTSGTVLRLTVVGAGDALDMDDAVARRVLRAQ